MQRPRIQMSTGAWIFASALVVTIAGPIGVYAAANSIVTIGNPNGTTTALVTPTRQLQTVMSAPTNVVHVVAGIGTSCKAVYTPPPGKAIVVTQITYDIGSGTPGTEYFASLSSAACSQNFDIADTVQAYETETRTYPSGLPLPSIGVYGYPSSTSGAAVFITGYLIAASQLPPDAPEFGRPLKGMPRGG